MRITDPAPVERARWRRILHTARADRMVPALQSPELPQPPAATPENLRPHLHGWSPYEPKRA
ncbi:MULTISPECIES: hypothetical protein [unclassified Streptomyces]|uniref:hypothetical protein n=1 Tax=unclassified Streptomyces TaxID=2593676 RepID=UPI002E179A68